MRRNKGFTLMEMMVVLAIIGILVAFATPKIMQYINEAQRKGALSQMQQMGADISLYISQNPNAILSTAFNAVKAANSDYASIYMATNPTGYTPGTYLRKFAGGQYNYLRIG